MSTKKERKNGVTYANRLLRDIEDNDFDNYRALIEEWNETQKSNGLPATMTSQRFFKLMNTYSPLIKSMMDLNPENSHLQTMGVHTAMSKGAMWAKNTGTNMPRIKSEPSISALKGIHRKDEMAAIVIANGPSLSDNESRTNHLDVLKEQINDFNGIVLLADPLLERCINMGIGDYVTVVDGADIISKFFDNDAVTNLPNTDHKLKAIMSSATSPKVLEKWRNETYFFVASIAHEILPNATPLMCDFTGLPDLNTGGNCGMLAWHMAAWMGCKDIAVIGMDYGYKPGVSLENTSNYNQWKHLPPEQLAAQYGLYHNEHYGIDVTIDAVYESFRDVAIEWFTKFDEHGSNKTFNCTEGGTIEGIGNNGYKVQQMFFQDFLDAHKI